MAEQLPLFGFQDMRPRLKVLFDRELVLKGKRQYDRGDFKGAAETLRDIRYKLENFCARINQKDE